MFENVKKSNSEIINKSIVDKFGVEYFQVGPTTGLIFELNSTS